VKKVVSPVEAYLTHHDGPTRKTLDSLVTNLRSLLPTADETLSYGMPCFEVRGKAVAGFAAFQHHCAYLPHSGSVIAKVPDVAHLTSTKGSLHIPLGSTLPKGAIKKLIRVRLDEISAVSNGKRIEFYDNGVVKAEGAMKNGELSGAWSWYRTDGTIMRTGSFRNGETVGEWSTYDRSGRLVRRTTKA
jgi:uncharacterized protein YdhG (YjbR/CyaY superfamily)